MKDDIHIKRMLRDNKKLMGSEAIEGLINKTHRLFLWTNSVPSNWWVAPINDSHAFVWHSDDEDKFNRPDIHPFVKLNDCDGVSVSAQYELADDAIEWYKNNPDCETKRYPK